MSWQECNRASDPDKEESCVMLGNTYTTRMTCEIKKYQPVKRPCYPKAVAAAPKESQGQHTETPRDSQSPILRTHVSKKEKKIHSRYTLVILALASVEMSGSLELPS